MRVSRFAAVAAVALAVFTAGPAGAPANEPTLPAPTGIGEQDQAALATLAAVAGPTSTVEAELVDWTECWLPSEHIIPDEDGGNGTGWRVICRVHWTEQGGNLRYQDTTCIGDFALDPMLDHCYRWVHTSDLEPRYEDFAGVLAG